MDAIAVFGTSVNRQTVQEVRTESLVVNNVCVGFVARYNMNENLSQQLVRSDSSVIHCYHENLAIVREATDDVMSTSR